MPNELVAIYCRLSEEDREKLHASEDSASIQNQKAMLLQYAAQQHWTVFRVYSDDDYTGADRNRPAFRELLRDAEAGCFQIVLCKTQSRFTRELELVEKYLHHLFPLWGIRFIGLVDHTDTANRGNKKSRQINGLVNEWYLEDLSENIRSVLDSRRKNGLHIGAFALYGYRKDPEHRGHLLIDEEAACIVREVFTLYAQGCGKTAIARRLNEQGVPNPTEYKRLQGLRYRQPPGKTGTLWRYSAISAMLSNEIYIGNMVQGKNGSVSYKTKSCRPRPRNDWYIVENTHPPIISRPLWEQVQARIAQQTRPCRTGTVGIFAHKVHCLSCGGWMRSTTVRGKRYLQCSTRRISPALCAGSFIAVDRLEQLVLSALDAFSARWLDRPRLEQELQSSISPQSEAVRLHRALELCRRAQNETLCALRSLYLDRVRGLLPSDCFPDLLAPLTERQQQLQTRLTQLKQEYAAAAAQESAAPSVSDRLNAYLHPAGLTRAMVDGLIDTIEVGRRLPGEAGPPVRIHWNF